MDIMETLAARDMKVATYRQLIVSEGIQLIKVKVIF